MRLPFASKLPKSKEKKCSQNTTLLEGKLFNMSVTINGYSGTKCDTWIFCQGMWRILHHISTSSDVTRNLIIKKQHNIFITDATHAFAIIESSLLNLLPMSVYVETPGHH